MNVQVAQYATICVIIVSLSLVNIFKTRLDQKRINTDIRVLKKRQAVQVRLKELDELESVGEA